VSEQTIVNPILRGFNPDPSIVRVGDDFYIATSTFEWYPGVQIHHSRDLCNWQLISRPLDNERLLDMRGCPDSCGVWAPCLSCCDGVFYLVYTNVRNCSGGFVDAQLGDPIESFTGLTLIGTDETARTKTYIRRSDDFRVGGVAVDGVTYSFYEGRLYFISVQMTGRQDAESVFAALEQTFGPGIETGTRPHEHIWPGGNVFVLYDFDPETNRGLAAMTSAPIQARIRLDRARLGRPR